VTDINDFVRKLQVQLVKKVKGERCQLAAITCYSEDVGNTPSCYALVFCICSVKKWTIPVVFATVIVLTITHTHPIMVSLYL
jgi:hypothetical protein